MKAVMLLIALSVSFVAAPNALAHGSHYAGYASSTAAAAFGDRVHPAVAAPEIVAAAFADPDGSCPSDSEDGHADHTGCCGGIVSCASGCGAAIAPEEPSQLSAPKAALVCSMTAVALGAGTGPADRPPRSFI
jgi:hypothetical protein